MSSDGGAAGVAVTKPALLGMLAVLGCLAVWIVGWVYNAFTVSAKGVEFSSEGAAFARSWLSLALGATFMASLAVTIVASSSKSRPRAILYCLCVLGGLACPLVWLILLIRDAALPGWVGTLSLAAGLAASVRGASALNSTRRGGGADADDGSAG